MSALTRNLFSTFDVVMALSTRGFMALRKALRGTEARPVVSGHSPEVATAEVAGAMHD